VREQQLAEVTRNYENSRANYQSMLQKKRSSELATNLETRQKGEQFRVLDAASLPKRPEEPTREEVVLFGWGAGFCLGFALAALREFTDRRIRTESDLYAVGDHPVLTSIPNVLLEPERVTQLRTRAAEVALAALLLTVSVGAGVRIWMT
jgi:capsular polysaccharide biosynthesis protein